MGVTTICAGRWRPAYCSVCHWLTHSLTHSRPLNFLWTRPTSQNCWAECGIWACYRLYTTLILGLFITSISLSYHQKSRQSQNLPFHQFSPSKTTKKYLFSGLVFSRFIPGKLTLKYWHALILQYWHALILRSLLLAIQCNVQKSNRRHLLAQNGGHYWNVQSAVILTSSNCPFITYFVRVRIFSEIVKKSAEVRRSEPFGWF